MHRHFQRPFTLPSGATEVVLIRHGSVGAPSNGSLVGGHGDPELTADGLRQAEALVPRLGGEALRALFVTPLSRTAATAAPLAAAAGLTPEVVDELREVHVGEWEGGFQERLGSHDDTSRRIFEEERWDVIPGAERMETFAARVAAGMQTVAAAAGPDASCAVVTHGGVIAEACRQATASRPFAFLGAENASISRLVLLPRGRWFLRCFNDTAHLAGLDGR